jgi:hypothetical protein
MGILAYRSGGSFLHRVDHTYHRCRYLERFWHCIALSNVGLSAAFFDGKLRDRSFVASVYTYARNRLDSLRYS